MSDIKIVDHEKVFARVGAKTIIQRQDGKILVLRRSIQTSRPGGWDFPGGASDKGENPEETVIRETMEETSLVISHPTLLTAHASINQNSEYIVILGYEAHIQNGNVIISWEHDAFEWISIGEALSREWPEFHRQLLEKVHNSAHPLREDESS